VKAFLTAAAMVAILAAPAYAQGAKGKDLTSAHEKKKAEEADQAYKNAIKSTTPVTPAIQADPWANARGTAPAKDK
jgi:hypothetical protein